MAKSKINLQLLSFIAFLIFLSYFNSGFSQNKDAAYRAFTVAQSAENRNDLTGAISLYREILNIYRNSSFAGESQFRIAVIYDEKLNNPKLAVKNYQIYINQYKGRNTYRAEIRIKNLTRYLGVDTNLYQRYIDIINSYSKKNRKECLNRMERFIDDNPDLPFLDEALLWLGNEYRGFKRKIEDKSELSGVERAIDIYKKLTSKFSKGKNRIIALKNLGDCYMLKGDTTQASKYYRAALKEGGKYGETLVGHYKLVADIHIFRRRILYSVIILFPILIACLIFILPFRHFSMDGLKKGLFHSLFFIPFLLLMIVITFLSAEPGKGNITGREPYLILTLMVITLAAIIFNGFVLESEERKKINTWLYFTVMALLLISLNYIAFYFLDLLQYIEKIFV